MTEQRIKYIFAELEMDIDRSQVDLEALKKVKHLQRRVDESVGEYN